MPIIVMDFIGEEAFEDDDGIAIRRAGLPDHGGG